MKRIYNGAAFCDSCSQCPVVDHDIDANKVVIHDPVKPDSGSFTLTPEEYNALLKNAKPIV